MSDETIEKEIMKLLERLCGKENISPDEELIDSGLLDSYAFIGVLSALEDMGIFIEPTETGIEHFRTPKEILRLAHKALAENKG